MLSGGPEEMDKKLILLGLWICTSSTMQSMFRLQSTMGAGSVALRELLPRVVNDPKLVSQNTLKHLIANTDNLQSRWEELAWLAAHPELNLEHRKMLLNKFAVNDRWRIKVAEDYYALRQAYLGSMAQRYFDNWLVCQKVHQFPVWTVGSATSANLPTDFLKHNYFGSSKDVAATDFYFKNICRMEDQAARNQLAVVYHAQSVKWSMIQEISNRLLQAIAQKSGCSDSAIRQAYFLRFSDLADYWRDLYVNVNPLGNINNSGECTYLYWKINLSILRPDKDTLGRILAALGASPEILRLYLPTLNQQIAELNAVSKQGQLLAITMPIDRMDAYCDDWIWRYSMDGGDNVSSIRDYYNLLYSTKIDQLKKYNKQECASFDSKSKTKLCIRATNPYLGLSVHKMKLPVALEGQAQIDQTVDKMIGAVLQDPQTDWSRVPAFIGSLRAAAKIQSSRPLYWGRAYGNG